jgi:proton-coupled amino acid transporter
MPSASPIIIFVQMIFILNLACSYPLSLYPINLVVESYLFKARQYKMKSLKRTWLKNLSRCVIVCSAIYLAIVLASKLDKFLALLGAMLCAPLAFTMPTLCHLKICAKTDNEKIQDIIIVGFSFVVLIFCTFQGLASWNE